MKSKKPLIDWRVDGGVIVFFEAPDGRALASMDPERLSLLLSPDYVKGQLQEEGQERLYPQEWGLKEFVGVQRLLQKCLNLAQIAGLWNVPEQSLRTFYNVSIQKFQHSPELVKPEQERQATSETEKDYCLSLRPANFRMSEDPRAGQNFLEAPKMATILKEQGPGGAAVKMELDFADLQAWIVKNEKYLTLFGYKDNLF